VERALAPRRFEVVLVWTVTITVGASLAQSPFFSAAPTSGPAPLTVTLCASAGIVIDFGDGSRSGLGMPPNGVCPTAGSVFAKHTYTTPGTYQLRGFPCPSPHAEVCEEVAQQASKVSITVMPRLSSQRVISKALDGRPEQATCCIY
jgi:hypothetical protein